MRIFALSCGLLIVLTPSVFSADLSELPRHSNSLTHALQRVSAKRMAEDVNRLSGTELNGRQTGTADDLVSGRVVADRLATLGLRTHSPADQTAGVTVSLIGPHPSLDFHVGPRSVAAEVGTDYLPILDSPSVSLTAPVVFVGYGISDPSRRFDEYEGVEVRNRIVLFLRGKPERYPGSVTQADKERVAREKGAVAFLTMTGPILNPYESRKGLGGRPLALYSQSGDERPLPGAWLSTELAEALFMEDLGKAGGSLSAIQQQLNELAPRSTATGVLAHLAWDSTMVPGRMQNIIGFLPARERTSADETIIIGAHRDHFGRQAGLLFAGADDNASGTAVLLEIARVLAQSDTRPRRSILFVSFSGEEQGLLGSRLYISAPAEPLHKTVAMINVDHAGTGNGRLTVGITGLPKTMAAEVGSRTGLSEKLDIFGFFPGGDHVPFKEAGVPTITVVSSGVHPHFHQPSDTAATVHPEILETTARYVLGLIWELAGMPE